MSRLGEGGLGKSGGGRSHWGLVEDDSVFI